MPDGAQLTIPPELLRLTPEEAQRFAEALREGAQPIPGGQTTPIAEPGLDAFLQFLRQQREIVEPIADVSALVGTGLSFIPTAPTQLVGRGLMMGGGAVGALTHGSRAAEALAEGEFAEAGIQGLSALFLRGAGRAAKGLKLPKGSTPSQLPTTPVKPSTFQKAAQQTAVKEGVAVAPPKRLPKPPAFKIAEAEKAGLKAGRQKLTERVKAKGGKIKQIEKGLAGELDRLGVEYRRTVSSLENVQKQLAKGGAPPELVADLGRQLQQLKQARSFIGKELQKGEAKAIEQSLREIGVGASALLQMMAGGATGALAGAATAEDEPLDVRVGRAVLGAGAGAFGARKLGGALAAPAETAQKALDYQYFSMLASPGPVGRAFFGGVGGWVRAITDRLIEGRFKDAAKIAGDIHKVPVRITQALIDPKVAREIAEEGTVPVHEGLLGAPGRVINASDYGWSRAITRGGYSLDQARNFTLSGAPRTAIGKGVLHLASGGGLGFRKAGDKTILAATPATPGTELVARSIVPFARPQVIAAEQALKPILPGVPMAERASSLLGNVATGAAGFAAEPFLPAGTESTAAAATGPGQLFFLGGAAARQAVEEGDPLMQALLKAAGTVGGEAATAFTGQGGRFGESLGAERVTGTIGNIAAQRLIPSFLRDIAQGMDPARGRETGFTTLTEEHGVAPREAILAPALARLPGARQVLPELPTEVDVRGAPRIPTDRSLGPIPDPVMRGIFPVSRTGTTIAGLSQLKPKARADDVTVQEFEKHGIPIKPPTLESFEPIEGVEFEATEADRLKLLKLQRDIEFTVYDRVIASPTYQALDDATKPKVLQRLKDRVTQRVGEALAAPTKLAAIKGEPK